MNHSLAGKVVIVTGASSGVGEAAARAFEAELVRNEDIIKEMHVFFERVGRPYSPSNDKQALVLVNRGDAEHPCTGGEVMTLAKAIQTSVYQRFGLQLEMEPVVV